MPDTDPISIPPVTGQFPLVSIVIVSWNAVETVKACLPSVIATDYPNFEILFADNASEDGTVEWIESLYPSVRIVRHPENWAFCRGNNEAVRHARGKYIVLLNNDVEVPGNWLTPLVERLESDSEIAAAQPKLLQYHDRTRFEYAGGSGGYIDRNGFPFTRGRIFFDMESDAGQYDDCREIFWATGAAVMVRKELYEALGGLDERFVMHMEEIDLCWRLKRLGYRIVVEPASSVYHMGGASLPRGTTRKMYLNYRNSLLTLYKNLPPRIWRRVITMRLFLDSIAALRSLALLRPRESYAILRAYASAYRMRSLYLNARPRASEPEVLPTYRGNIVADYFLFGRKMYSDLPPAKFTDR